MSLLYRAVLLFWCIKNATATTLRGNTAVISQQQQDDEPTLIHHRRTVSIPSDFNNIVLDENLVNLSILSAKIAACVNKDNVQSVPECASAQVFDSTWGPDKALVVKREGICFAAFQATTWSTSDWEQNLNPGMEDDVCSPHNGICCPSRRGFANAYRKVSYLTEFEQTLEECKQSCENGDCDVILTGHSQGGAVAMVGAIYLEPTAVFTFGQPPTMEDPCYAYDTSRIFRYVNTVVVNGDLRYDIVPFLGIGPIDHMGHLIVLSHDDTENVAYYRDHEAPDITFTDWAYFSVQQVHSMTSHIAHLEALQNFPIGLDGWAIGQHCSDLGSECVSPHMCSQGFCSTGENDEWCDDDNDCLSGRCDGWPQSRCMSKEQNGDLCNEDSDCISDRCKTTWTGWRCK